MNKGSNNGQWKGDKVGYFALHEWVRNHKPKPICCEKCGCIPYSTFLDLANISGDYKRDVNDFEWLCRSCHMVSDGRLAKLQAAEKPPVQRNKKGQYAPVS